VSRRQPIDISQMGRTATRASAHREEPREMDADGRPKLTDVQLLLPMMMPMPMPMMIIRVQMGRQVRQQPSKQRFAIDL